MQKQMKRTFTIGLLFLEGDLYAIFQMKMVKEKVHKGMGGYGG